MAGINRDIGGCSAVRSSSPEVKRETQRGEWEMHGDRHDNMCGMVSRKSSGGSDMPDSVHMTLTWLLSCHRQEGGRGSFSVLGG